jgi:hypothetical protein
MTDRDANDQLLLLNHEIRQTESYLATARRRRQQSNISLALGPVVLVILYGLWWIPAIGHHLLLVIYVPAVLAALFFAIATVKLKITPGGPLQGAASPGATRRRASEGALELQLARQRDQRKTIAASVDTPAKVRRLAYKDEAYADIHKLREESSGYRRVNNLLQAVLIIGSLGATGTAALTAEIPDIRWATLAISILVGGASGFMGYFKYKERSYYLQQTADAIESEWEAVEVGVGRYKKLQTEDERLAEFVEEVHRLKSEQKKRQQNLEQPPDSKNSQE